jgi:hypothetical protein
MGRPVEQRLQPTTQRPRRQGAWPAPMRAGNTPGHIDGLVEGQDVTESPGCEASQLLTLAASRNARIMFIQEQSLGPFDEN